MNIPLTLQQTVDKPIWKLNRNGKYSVCSAYYHLMEVIIDHNHLKVDGNWRKLWQLEVPKKVKLFLWCTLRGCLPVHSRIVQKGIQSNNKCPHCEIFEENEWCIGIVSLDASVHKRFGKKLRIGSTLIST
jgi:hypothetical protein